MKDNSAPRHIPEPELADYFAAKLPEAKERMIEEHLAECSTCTQEARRIWPVSGVLNAWTAEEHGKAYWRVRLANAVEAAELKPQYSAWRERLSRWSKRWAGRSEGAVLIVVEAPGRASRLITGELEALLRPGARWNFAPVPAIPRIRGGTGSDMSGAASELLNVASAPGSTSVRIEVKDTNENREVVVRVDNVVAGQPSPLVLLVPSEPEGEPLLAEPIKQPGTTYHLARFQNPPPGLYSAALEPVDPGDE